MKKYKIIRIIIIMLIFVLYISPVICKANDKRNDNMKNNIELSVRDNINDKMEDGIEDKSEEDIEDESEDSSSLIGTILMQSFALGAIASTIICVIIGFKHKPVKISKNANQYLDVNSINITNGYDHFTNYTITKIPLNNK